MTSSSTFFKPRNKVWCTTSGPIFTHSSSGPPRPHTCTTKIFSLSVTFLNSAWEEKSILLPHIGHIKTTDLAVCVLWRWISSYAELWNRRQATTGLWPLWGSSQNESCCSDHQNKSLYQLGHTDSGASVLINPVLPLVGEIMQPETARWYQRISAPQSVLWWRRAEGDEDEEGEKRNVAG